MIRVRLSPGSIVGSSFGSVPAIFTTILERLSLDGRKKSDLSCCTFVAFRSTLNAWGLVVERRLLPIADYDSAKVPAGKRLTLNTCVVPRGRRG